MKIRKRQAVQNVVALRLGRVEILAGGFANLVFYSIDDTEIEPTIVTPVGALPDIIMALTKATATSVMGGVEPAFN